MLANRINTTLQNQNADVLRSNANTNENFTRLQRDYHKLHSKLDKIKPSSSSDGFKRDELNELYEFTYKFDGTLGETALQFRENVRNYVDYIAVNAGPRYSEVRVLS